jgi:hypothetical protein
MVPLWCNNIVVALPLCDMPGVDRRTTPAEAVGFGGNPAPRRVKIRSVRPYRNAAGTIRAFLSAESPSGMIINGLRLMIGSRGSPWIAMPDIKRREENDKPVLNPDRRPIFVRSSNSATAPPATVSPT